MAINTSTFRHTPRVWNDPCKPDAAKLFRPVDRGLVVKMRSGGGGCFVYCTNRSAGRLIRNVWPGVDIGVEEAIQLRARGLL